MRFSIILSMLMLSYLSNVCGLSFNCKFIVEKQIELYSLKFPDRVGCVVEIESYEGEETRMVSHDSTAVEKYPLTKVKSENISPLMNLMGSEPMTKITEDVKIQGHRFEIHPQGIGSIFPYIKSFILSAGNLFKLRKEDLKQFPNAEHLDYSGNKIQYLESDLFIYNPKICLVEMNNNELKQISSKLGLEKLPKFVGLSLNNNLCTDSFYFCDSKDSKKCSEFLSKFMAEMATECPQLETNTMKDISSDETNENLRLNDLSLVQNSEFDSIKEIEMQMPHLNKELLKIQNFVQAGAEKTKKFESEILKINQKMAEFTKVIEKISEMALLLYEKAQKKKLDKKKLLLSE